MTRKSCCSRKSPRPANRSLYLIGAITVLGFLLPGAAAAHAGDDAPQWMHALAAVPLPSYDEETDAVLLYSERNVVVQSPNNLKISERKAYKILRPGGRDYGEVAVEFGSNKKITNFRAWCIPATGRDYQVKEKDATDVSPSSLITDMKFRVIRIPAAEPGSIVGYEYETEEQPMVLQDTWDFQSRIPARETRYSLELPGRWTFLSKWANFAESKPSQAGNNRWQWQLSEVKPIDDEEDMPAPRGVEGQMVVYFVPPSETAANAFTNWREMGEWYRGLTSGAGRMDASPELKQAVVQVTGSASSTLGKMQAIGKLVQESVRYVAVELGIGGWQPHAAADVFVHRYGDCKDKATLTITMLHEIGVESYYVIVNASRGAVTAETPPNVYAFNHAIVAIRLPENVSDPSLVSVLAHPKYGNLLIFDPTDELTPLGQLASDLQSSYGLLVGPEGGELLQLPTQPPKTNSLDRTAKLTLDSSGTLKGDVTELRKGDQARRQRGRMAQYNQQADIVRPIEGILGASLPNFRILKVSIVNLNKTNEAFGFDYSFEAVNYAKNAGGLVLVRPRVIGVKAIGIAKTKQPRQYPIEFNGVGVETDSFDITLPAGYQVDELPNPADADYSFGSYHSTTVVDAGAIHYHRRYEIKQLTVPVSEADKVKRFYQVIAGDERNMVVLKPTPK